MRIESYQWLSRREQPLRKVVLAQRAAIRWVSCKVTHDPIVAQEALEQGRWHLREVSRSSTSGVQLQLRTRQYNVQRMPELMEQHVWIVADVSRVGARYHGASDVGLVGLRKVLECERLLDGMMDRECACSWFVWSIEEICQPLAQMRHSVALEVSRECRVPR